MGVADIARIAHTTDQQMSGIGQVEMGDQLLETQERRVENLRARRATHQDEGALFDGETVADGIMQAVDDSLELSADAIEIDRGSEH